MKLHEKTPGILQTQSYDFALKAVQICRFLIDQKREFILSKQFLRSATSVGANIEEAQFAQSRADFISKLSIALKEANESRYWLRLLGDSGYMEIAHGTDLHGLIKQIISMLVSSVKTSKNNAS